MQMRSDKKRQNEVFLQDPIGKDKEGNEITFIDIIKSDKECVMNEVALRLESKKLNSKIESALTERERTIIRLRYGLMSGESLTQREIAKMLDISRSYVSRIEKKAIKKLLKEIKEPCI